MRPLAECFALFDDATWPDRPALLLSEPVSLIEGGPEAVDAALAAIETEAAAGRFVGGYCAYELGYMFERRLMPLMPETGRPLLRFVAFAKARVLSAEERDAFLGEAGDGAPAFATPRATIDEATYRRRIGEIRDLIEAGDVYQVNFTFKLKAAFEGEGDAKALFAGLRRSSRAGGAALLRFPDEDIVSLSPERFVTVKGREITARPMKGTAPRAPDWRGDAEAKLALQRDPKQRAENLMIVDLLRNDLSRVAEPGSVEVTDLYTAETYPRFHTLTSGIRARLREGVGFADVLRATFPCGSVTGAPKIRAMEIIRASESEPRGVYCGAVGYVTKDRMSFTVAIRTLALRAGEAELGIGGGIVWDSTSRAEYAEALLKARFVTAPLTAFRLIETLRFTPHEGLFLLARHLERLAHSARYFGFVYDEALVRARLAGALGDQRRDLRVRLTLGERGDIEVTSSPLTLPSEGDVWRYAVSPQRTDSRDPFVHHKTTMRALHDGELARAQREAGADEVVFLNERGEVTEGSRSTLFLEREGAWLTPPLSCGVLDGCLRRELIERGDPPLVEQRLTLRDLSTGTVWFGNAVRGLIRGTAIAEHAVDSSPALSPAFTIP